MAEIPEWLETLDKNEAYVFGDRWQFNENTIMVDNDAPSKEVPIIFESINADPLTVYYVCLLRNNAKELIRLAKTGLEHDQ